MRRITSALEVGERARKQYTNVSGNYLGSWFSMREQPEFSRPYGVGVGRDLVDSWLHWM